MAQRFSQESVFLACDFFKSGPTLPSSSHIYANCMAWIMGSQKRSKLEFFILCSPSVHPELHRIQEQKKQTRGIFTGAALLKDQRLRWWLLYKLRGLASNSGFGPATSRLRIGHVDEHLQQHCSWAQVSFADVQQPGHDAAMSIEREISSLQILLDSGGAGILC